MDWATTASDLQNPVLSTVINGKDTISIGGTDFQ